MPRERIANMGSSAYSRTCAAPGYALQELYRSSPSLRGLDQCYFEAGVTQPSTNCVQVNPCPQHLGCCGVAKRVWADPLRAEGRDLGGSGPHAALDQLPHARACDRGSAPISKHSPPGGAQANKASSASAEPCSNGHSLVFPPFPRRVTSDRSSPLPDSYTSPTLS